MEERYEGRATGVRWERGKPRSIDQNTTTGPIGKGRASPAFPIVDESNSAPTTEQEAMKMEKQQKQAPTFTIRPASRKPKSIPRVPEDGVAQSPTRIEGACGRTTPRRPRRTKMRVERTLPNGRDSRWTWTVIPQPKVRHTRRTPHRRKKKETEARPYDWKRQKRRKKQRQTYRQNRRHGKKMRARTKIQKRWRAQMKQVTMVLHMQMTRPHPKKPHPLQSCDRVVFTCIPCYVACATSLQPLCNLCKRSLSRGCTHLHTGCTSYLRRKR